jgi:hypothetical protein
MQSNDRSQDSLSWESSKVWPVTRADEEIWIGRRGEDRISQVVFVCSSCSFVNYETDFMQIFVFPKSSEESHFKTSLTTCQKASDRHWMAQENTVD